MISSSNKITLIYCRIYNRYKTHPMKIQCCSGCSVKDKCGQFWTKPWGFKIKLYLWIETRRSNQDKITRSTVQYLLIGDFEPLPLTKSSLMRYLGITLPTLGLFYMIWSLVNQQCFVILLQARHGQSCHHPVPKLLFTTSTVFHMQVHVLLNKPYNNDLSAMASNVIFGNRCKACPYSKLLVT